MKHGTPALPVAELPVEETKRGRPSKEETRRRKMAMASDAIAMLIESKPTKNKIRNYLEDRIAQLDMEKR
jgi:hypothetical protein